MESVSKRYWNGSDYSSCVGVPSLIEYSDYHRKLSRALQRMGGLYTFDDIMEDIRSGAKQSFSHNNTWVVTEVHDFPRRRVLDILFVVGDASDLDILHDRILDFATNCRATLVRAYGRRGWEKYVPGHGWKVVDVVYYKELTK